MFNEVNSHLLVLALPPQVIAPLHNKLISTCEITSFKNISLLIFHNSVCLQHLAYDIFFNIPCPPCYQVTWVLQNTPVNTNVKRGGREVYLANILSLFGKVDLYRFLYTNAILSRDCGNNKKIFFSLVFSYKMADKGSFSCDLIDLLQLLAIYVIFHCCDQVSCKSIIVVHR